MWGLGLLGLLLLVSVAWGQETVGLLKSTQGEVTLVRQDVRTPALPGLRLQVGDTLLTGTDTSTVAVVLIDDTRMALGPRSRLVLHQYRWNPTTQQGQARAELGQGTLAVESGLLGRQGSGNTLAVTTPKATVRVQDAQVGFRVKEP